MAIQNFLSGGYYGKLGATVGQRWKNKRTIRTYVVPANPRTPTQQANRNKFANAVTFAQMGMQMNYYCTLFENENFTKWNYRMKVAQELKNAGLTDLALIPLYPTSFNPPILLDELSMATISSEKHISFAVPKLEATTDRLLSIMFALYDENDVFLGYKLYLGNYYASNPGYIEVDVDDIKEINTHCFARIVSNDDENSSVDLIGSPKLQIKAGAVDIHTFNKTIMDIETSAEDIEIIFKEPWAGVSTINKISFDLECISNGKRITVNSGNLQLRKNGDYCSVILPFKSETNSMIPAFTENCGIRNLNVNYTSYTWRVTIDNATENYKDFYPEREIETAAIFNVSDTGDIRFRFKFDGNVATQTKQLKMACGGRLSKTEEEIQNFEMASDNEYIIFTCVDKLKQYPMMNSSDYIKLTDINITCEGVIYTIPAQKINLRNAIRMSYYLESLQWNFTREGGGSAGYGLEFLSMSVYIEGALQEDVEELNKPAFSYIENVVGANNCVPLSSESNYLQDVGSMYLSFRDDYAGALYADQVKETSTVKLATIPSITINGVKYTFSDNWMLQNFKTKISNWEY